MSYIPNICGVPTISVLMLALLFLLLCCSEDVEDMEYLGEEFF
jgi:hypothetical protein